MVSHIGYSFLTTDDSSDLDLHCIGASPCIYFRSLPVCSSCLFKEHKSTVCFSLLQMHSLFCRGWVGCSISSPPHFLPEIQSECCLSLLEVHFQSQGGVCGFCHSSPPPPSALAFAEHKKNVCLWQTNRDYIRTK